MSVADVVTLTPIHRGGLGFSFAHNHNYYYSLKSVSVFLHLSSSSSTMPMLILDVKLKIQTVCNGLRVTRQKLVFRGRELARNASRVAKDYGVVVADNNSVMHLLLKKVCDPPLLVTVVTASGKVFDFHVDRRVGRDVGYLKKRISKEVKGFHDVDDQEIFFRGEKLRDDRVIDGICTDGIIHLLLKKTTESSIGKDFLLEPLLLNPKLPQVIEDMIDRTVQGLNSGNSPVRSAEGTGGTYLMQDSSGLDYVSVFKPTDEEPMAVNNPQQLPLSSDGQGLKRGTRVGEGAIREVAAYLLDHPKKYGLVGFAGVPPTAMVRSFHNVYNNPKGVKDAKVGSLQMFMKNDGSCEDIGPGGFPVEQVHKISVFDIRMANADRHAGNILIGKGEDGRTVLIPIDHGYCLPENFEDCTFEWLYWPQAKVPFSEDTVNYINSLDAEQDIALLRLNGWDVPEAVSRVLRISTMLLKKGVERKLTAYQIGSMMCRETVDKDSAIEEIVRDAHNSVLPASSEATFLEAVSVAMDARLDELTK